MVGKAQARAPPLVKKNLKAKAGAPAAANTKRTLSKIVSTINEEVKAASMPFSKLLFVKNAFFLFFTFGAGQPLEVRALLR